MESTLNTLEYDKVLNIVAGYAVTSVASNAILSLEPLQDIDDVRTALDTTNEAMQIACTPIIEFDDITEILKKIRVGATCSVADLAAVWRVVRCGKRVQASLSIDKDNIPKLAKLASGMDNLSALDSYIGRIIDEDGEIRDDASTTLRSIRKTLAYVNKKLRDKLSSYINKQNDINKYLQDDIITVRNGRYVLPIKSEYQSQVQGFLHDRSATGATVFIEPADIISLNNDIRQAMLDEEREKERLLREATVYMIDYVASLNNNMSLCVLVDTIFARADYARESNSKIPLVNHAGRIRLAGARHPLIDRDRVVPIDIDIETNRVLLISGPNTGGKTVTIKTIGLLSAMAASGMCVPCDSGCEIAVFDRYFCCLGDEQSIATAFSTFSSHIIRINDILQSADKYSLVLIDELGTGTDPEEGASLAVAITEELIRIGCVAAITSHYSKLKEYGTLSDHIQNVSMYFDSASLAPTYKLVKGAGASNALAICQRLGLDKAIVDRARAYMSEQVLEYNALLLRVQETYANALDELEQAKVNNERLRVEIDNATTQKNILIDKQNKLTQNAKRETDRLVASAREEADALIESIKEQLMESSEQALLRAKQMRTRLDDIDKRSDKEIASSYTPLSSLPSKGDRVLVMSVNSIGTVREVNGKGNIMVVVGAATIKCVLSNLASAVQTVDTTTTRSVPKIRDIKGASANNDACEIKVLGQTVAEAIVNIEPFIDNCYVSGRTELRIVHGKGSGMLGKGIQSYLRSLKYIKSYRYGGYGEGEKGVTIVYL